MLVKANRLQKQKDIEQVLKKGKGLKEDFLVLKTIKNNLGQSRFGFVVSLKVSKKAVVRHKIKRRLRELVRARLKTIKPNTDNLFIAQPGFQTKNFREIKSAVEILFKKAKLL